MLSSQMIDFPVLDSFYTMQDSTLVHREVLIRTSTHSTMHPN